MTTTDPTKAFEADGVTLYASTPEEEVNLRSRGFTEAKGSATAKKKPETKD